MSCQAEKQPPNNPKCTPERLQNDPIITPLGFTALTLGLSNFASMEQRREGS